MLNRLKKVMNDAMLEQVNGGTYTLNSIAENRYNDLGIKTCYHNIWKDEFWLPDGTKTDMAGADKYVKSIVGEEQFQKWYEEHHSASSSDVPNELMNPVPFTFAP